MHGGHQVAQKLITQGLSASAALSTDPPSSVASENVGGDAVRRRQGDLGGLGDREKQPECDARPDQGHTESSIRVIRAPFVASS